MNARLYDPVLHTFLSPDALIADPSNPQNYNRYAYALNNPLMYVDYSGNEVVITTAMVVTAAIIGGEIAGVSYVGINLYNGTAITWGGLAKSILVGAVSGVASMGVGAVAQSATTAIFGTVKGTIQNGILLALTRGVMHGVAQGFIQGVSGGDFGQSFITAMATSIAGDAFGMLGTKISDSIVGKALFGSVVGGVTSNLQGGNFWEGATIGLTVSLLNCAGKKLYPAIDRMMNPEKKYSKVQAIVRRFLANQKKDFFGAKIILTSFKGLNNFTLLGAIHTSELTFYNYSKVGFQIQSDGFIHESTMLLLHEFGHFLHARYATSNFYSYAMWSSAATASNPNAGSNWTEIKANTYSYYYFGQPKGWNFNEYPIDSNYLDKQTIQNLQNHK